MNPKSRTEFFIALASLAEKHPHWRVGQLICNVAGWADVDVWDVEDDQLLSAIDQQQQYQESANSRKAVKKLSAKKA